MKKLCAMLAVFLLLYPTALPAEEEEAITPREDFISRMIGTAREEYDKAAGRARRAASASDIYICKNFTVHMFREHRDAFGMAEFPGVRLVIPDNLPREDSKPYVYGAAWIDIPPEDGNPFYAAASFRYNKDLGKAENRELALSFLRQARRGDFFQMAANYYYGVGAHSLVFTEDYDAQSDSLTWTDSNMKGEKRDGVRYGYIQFGAVKKIDWFADAFCRKGYGATLYRLREDIVYAQP